MNNFLDDIAGVINIAYYQFSGDYMLYCTDNGLYLRDYSGYSVEIDQNISFLPQLSRFLRTKSGTVLNKSNNIFYGAYQIKNHKFYHISYYIGQYYKDGDYRYKMPDRCIILKSPNNDLTSETYSTFYRDSDVLKTYNLYNIGIDNIISEFLSLEYQDRIKLKFPVEFVWADDKSHVIVNFYGWNYDKECVDKVTLNVTDYVLNMLDADDSINFISNLILEKYNNSHLIFPRFINFGFEFDYTIPTNLGKPEFQNFFGYLTYAEELTESSLEDTSITSQVSGKLYIELTTPTRHEYRNITYQTTEHLRSVDEISHDVVIQEIEEQPEEIIMTVNNLSSTNIFEIIDLENNEVILRYRVLASDIKPTLYQTVIYVFNKMKNLSSNYFFIENVHVRDNSSIVKIEFSSKTTIKIYNDSVLLHSYTSNSIKLTDVMLVSPLDSIIGVVSLDINGVNYHIEDVFTYDGQNILRMDFNPNLQYLTSVPVYKTYTEKLISAKPIPFLQNSSLLHRQPEYDFTQYWRELCTRQNYIPNTASETQNTTNRIGAEVFEPFVDEVTNNEELIQRDAEANLVTSILKQPSNILLKNSVCNDISVHTLNYDVTKFDVCNGCDDIKQYHYFLIDIIPDTGDINIGHIPVYLHNETRPFDNRIYRYIDSNQHIRSLVYKISNERCQTVFLGKSYLLESKYDGYRFSVMYRYNTNDTLPMYYAKIDNVNKYLDIYINYRFPFLSLISDSDSVDNIFDISLLYIDTTAFLNTETGTNDYTYGHTFDLIFGTLLNRRHFEYVRSRGQNFDTYYRTVLDQNNNPYNQYLVFLSDNSFANFEQIYGISYRGDIDCYITKRIRERRVDNTYVDRLIAYLKISIKNVEFVDQKFVICKDVVVTPYPDGYYQNELVITIEDGHQVYDYRGYLQMYDARITGYNYPDVDNRKLNLVDYDDTAILQDKYRHYYKNPINPIDTIITPPLENIPERLFMLNYLTDVSNDTDGDYISTEMYNDNGEVNIGNFYRDCSLKYEWFRLVYKRVNVGNVTSSLADCISISVVYDGFWEETTNNVFENHNVILDNEIELIDVIKHTNRFWIDGQSLDFNDVSNYRTEFIDILNGLRVNETYEFDMIDYNPFWYLIQRVLRHNSISLMNTVDTVEELLNPLTFNSFSQYIENNLLPIVDSGEITDNSVYIKNIKLSENFNMDNRLLYRFSTFYEPNFNEVDIFNFSQYWYVRNDVKKIKTLFSDDFNNGLSATGFWKEISGYPLSSLYCGQDEIILTLSRNTDENIDIVLLMISNRVYSQANMTIGDNSSYIRRNLDYNYQEYISKSYIQYVLTYMYQITKVLVDSKNVKFEFNIKDFTLKLQDFGLNTKIYLNRK